MQAMKMNQSESDQLTGERSNYSLAHFENLHLIKSYIVCLHSYQKHFIENLILCFPSKMAFSFVFSGIFLCVFRTATQFIDGGLWLGLHVPDTTSPDSVRWGDCSKSSLNGFQFGETLNASCIAFTEYGLHPVACNESRPFICEFDLEGRVFIINVGDSLTKQACYFPHVYMRTFSFS